MNMRGLGYSTIVNCNGDGEAEERGCITKWTTC